MLSLAQRRYGERWLSHLAWGSVKTLKPIFLSDEVLSAIQKEIKRKTKFNVELKDLKQAVERILGE